MSKLLQLLVFVLLLGYLFYNIDIEHIDFTIFSVWAIAGTFGVIFLGQVIVALRWMKMSQLSFKISFETMIVSTALNVLLPAKLGELSKALYLKKFYRFSYHRAVSIIIIERFFDIVALFLLICLWSYFYFTDPIIKKSMISMGSFIVLVVIFFNTKPMLLLIKKIPFQWFRVYGQKIYKQINKLFKNSFSIFPYTAILWFVYLLSNIVFFKYAVHFGLSDRNVLGLFIFSSIALALPLTPAGIGAFEGAVVLFLTLHGVSKEDALMSATAYHIILLAVDFLLFYPFLIIKNIKFKELIK